MGQPEERLLEFVESDGQPLAETELHLEQIFYLRDALRLLACERQADESAHVGSNLLFYYDPEDARRRVSPDVFLTRGLADAKLLRRTWKLWEDGRAPDLIVEVASRGTYEEDLGAKRDLYRDVFRTSEYLVFDPEGFMDEGPLRAWRLSSDGSVYRRVGTTTRVNSRVARASFEVIDGCLRLVDSQGVVPGGVSEGLAAGRAARRAEGLVEGTAAGRAEGMAAGRAEGLAEGMAAGMRESIVQVLEIRFGPLPRRANERLRSRLAGLDDDALQRAHMRSVTVASADAFLASLEA